MVVEIGGGGMALSTSDMDVLILEQQGPDLVSDFCRQGEQR